MASAEKSRVENIAIVAVKEKGATVSAIDKDFESAVNHPLHVERH